MTISLAAKGMTSFTAVLAKTKFTVMLAMTRCMVAMIATSSISGQTIMWPMAVGAAMCLA